MEIGKTMTMRDVLMAIYDRLFAAFGPRGWWPGDGAFEIAVGAILTQNTNWKNVEKALHGLKSRGLLDPRSLARLEKDRLAALLRPAGYYNIKAERLKAFLFWLEEAASGDMAQLSGWPTRKLRSALLNIKGIGPETADSILLYAIEKPSFVVDAYTRRVLSRHGLAGPHASYDELKALFETHLPGDVPLFNEYHALLVEVGKQYCRPKPLCEGCPLEEFRQDTP
jgi:endonuclease-3 related protein